MGYLTEQDAKIIAERFAHGLDADVALEFFAPTTGGIALPGQDAETAEYTRQILIETAGLSPKLHLNVHSMVAEPEAAAALGIVRTPATAVIGRQDYGIRYYGIPAGYEFATLLELIVLASKGQAPLAPEPRTVLSRLKGDAHIQVFVTPT
jgi:alkyl hydroperoxide reductase subunit AhpF